MKYQWLEYQLEEVNSCDELSKRLGCKVKRIDRPYITVGYEEVIDEFGRRQIPITKRGIEIELDDETPEMLEKLDREFSGLKRGERKISYQRNRPAQGQHYETGDPHD